MFYRRTENAFSTLQYFERVTIDRATRQVTSELIEPNNEIIVIKERGVLEGTEDGKATTHEHYIYDD